MNESTRLDIATRSGDPSDLPGVEVSVVMPCLNEAQTLKSCIQGAQSVLRENGITGEIIVADNGSTDGSVHIAKQLGARVVGVKPKGYGSALMGGIQAARGRYVVMADADDSYDFAYIPDFLAKLREGCDLVMGNRFAGGIQRGAMPALHRYLGNPLLSGIGRLFFKSPVRDFHCGMRGFRKTQSIDFTFARREWSSQPRWLSRLQLTDCWSQRYP